MLKPEELEQSIRENAQQPAEAAGDSGRVEQHSLSEQIEADRYLASKEATRSKLLVLRITKIVAPGAVLVILFAEHLTAEYRARAEGRGRTVDEWKIRPEQADNHWLACLVGCAVAAGTVGCLLFGTEAPEPQRKKLSM
jgi:hypothetical protein